MLVKLLRVFRNFLWAGLSFAGKSKWTRRPVATFPCDGGWRMKEQSSICIIYCLLGIVSGFMYPFNHWAPLTISLPIYSIWPVDIKPNCSYLTFDCLDPTTVWCPCPTLSADSSSVFDLLVRLILFFWNRNLSALHSRTVTRIGS